jgi:hypothetical protein
VKLARPLELVPVPVLDHELGHLAVDEQLDGLVARLADDGIDAHGREPSAPSLQATFPRHHRGIRATAFHGIYSKGDMLICRDSA